MAAPPRFFKVFISHLSSDSMLIPISYYDELPRLLPKTAILQGTGGCVWNVAMKKKRDEVYFEQGWTRFVADNSLTDGDFLTFVYDGDRIFEVSIYGPHGSKETRAVTEVENDDEEDSDDTYTSSESVMANTIPRSKNIGKLNEEAVDGSDVKEENVYSKDTETSTCSEFKMANTILRSKNNGKVKEEVVDDSDDKEDSDYSEDKDTDTCSEDTDSDYMEAFGRLDVEESSNSDTSYSPDHKVTTTLVKSKATNPKDKGKSNLTEDVDDVEKVKKKREIVKAKIKNPEAHLDDPKNIYFETGVKNRPYELLVRAQLVKDYGLKFLKYICLIDPKGELEAKTVRWGDERVCIKGFKYICERNELEKKDRIVCELFRRQNLVYAVKIHVVRGKDLERTLV